jgi:hypothetical protein
MFLSLFFEIMLKPRWGQGASRSTRREPSLRACQFPTGDAWLQSRSALSLEQWLKTAEAGEPFDSKGWSTGKSVFSTAPL